MKVVVAGPKGAGKTTIANYLSGHSDKLQIDGYNPTAGVRILDLETRTQGEDLNVQIWDASGDNMLVWPSLPSSISGDNVQHS